MGEIGSTLPNVRPLFPQPPVPASGGGSRHIRRASEMIMPHDLDANKDLVQRAFDAWDRGDAATFDDVYAADVAHPDAEIGGRYDLKALLGMWFEAFPDLAHDVEAMVAEDDWVVTRFTISGTHDGPFQGIEPTGEAFEIRGVAMERIADGQIVERWLVEPVLDIYRQLGVLEDPTA